MHCILRCVLYYVVCVYYYCNAKLLIFNRYTFFYIFSPFSPDYFEAFEVSFISSYFCVILKESRNLFFGFSEEKKNNNVINQIIHLPFFWFAYITNFIQFCPLHIQLFYLFHLFYYCTRKLLPYKMTKQNCKKNKYGKGNRKTSGSIIIFIILEKLGISVWKI